MNTIHKIYSPIVRFLGGTLSIIAFLTLPSRPLQAQGIDEKQIARIVWVNSYYGANNVGVGLAARYAAIGIGTTVFAFAGDTTEGIGVRPGIVGASVDAYLAIDFNSWLAIYGNIGGMGRLATYKDRNNFPKQTVISAGGGFQISLASHLMLGIGYNTLITSTEGKGGSTYNPIQSVVAQVGYRL